MYFPASAWFAAFVLTLAIEAPVVVLIVRRVEPSLPRVIGLVVFANLATHPIVWYVLTQPFLVGTVEYTAVAETWAVGAEALFYAVAIGGLSPRRSLATALAANAASFLIGSVVWAIWPEYVA